MGTKLRSQLRATCLSPSRAWLTVLRLAVAVLLGAVASGWPCRLQAHTPSETYLTFLVAGTNVTGHWDVALKDLDQGLGAGLDPTRLATLPAAEREQREEALALDILARLTVKADETALPLAATDYATVSLNSGEYVRLAFMATSPRPPAVLGLDAHALFALDPNMHGLLRLEHEGRTESVSFDQDHPLHDFELAGPGHRWAQWRTFVENGMWHIWTGPDHILFLVALLLPAVLSRKNGSWEGLGEFRPALIGVLKIVTAFTVAHSVTLSLAALEVVRLPTRFVESVIAASVALAALNNLLPLVRSKSWVVAFAFGLVHGFGFASGLTSAGWTRETLVPGLVGFNVGVELGQLAIVLLFLPLAFGLRRSRLYQTGILKFGSGFVVLVAALWMVERIFVVSFMPF